MARGTEAKEYITNKLIEVFEGTFLNGKEIRIPYIEDGENLEIKVTLTCAKDNLRDIIKSNSVAVYKDEDEKESPNPQLIEPTQEEKQRVQDFLDKLNNS